MVRSPRHVPRFPSLPLTALFAMLSFAALALVARTAAAEVQLQSGYPLDLSAKRIPAVTEATKLQGNVGINRVECLSEHVWSVRFSSSTVSTDAAQIEVWAKSDNSSCGASTARYPASGATCYKVMSFDAAKARVGLTNLDMPLRPIVAAITQAKSVDNPADVPLSVCDPVSSGPPAFIYLHFLSVNVSGSPVYSDGVATNYFQTGYDLAAQPGPGTLTVEPANNALIATWSLSSTTNASDFQKWRAYCVPDGTVIGGDSGAPDSTGTDSSVTDSVADTAPADTGVTDTGADADDAADAADGASTDTGADTGTGITEAAAPTGCEIAGLQQGQLPSPAVLAYACQDSTTISGKMTITGLKNDVGYHVAVAAVDKWDNPGTLSAVACGTPQETDDFYRVYRRDGGTAGGGWCNVGSQGRRTGDDASAAHGSAILVGLLALGAIARRVRR